MKIIIFIENKKKTKKKIIPLRQLQESNRLHKSSGIFQKKTLRSEQHTTKVQGYIAIRRQFKFTGKLEEKKQKQRRMTIKSQWNQPLPKRNPLLNTKFSSISINKLFFQKLSNPSPFDLILRKSNQRKRTNKYSFSFHQQLIIIKLFFWLRLREFEKKPLLATTSGLARFLPNRMKKINRSINY